MDVILRKESLYVYHGIKNTHKKQQQKTAQHNRFTLSYMKLWMAEYDIDRYVDMLILEIASRNKKKKKKKKKKNTQII